MRLEKLRNVMKSEGIDFYVIPTDDFHGSEYVGDYFKTRAWVSGFSGSAGTLVVGESYDNICLNCSSNFISRVFVSLKWLVRSIRRVSN